MRSEIVFLALVVDAVSLQSCIVEETCHRSIRAVMDKYKDFLVLQHQKLREIEQLLSVQILDDIESINYRIMLGPKPCSHLLVSSDETTLSAVNDWCLQSGKFPERTKKFERIPYGFFMKNNKHQRMKYCKAFVEHVGGHCEYFGDLLVEYAQCVTDDFVETVLAREWFDCLVGQGRKRQRWFSSRTIF